MTDAENRRGPTIRPWAAGLGARALAQAPDPASLGKLCGRYRLTTKAEELAQRYHVQMAEDLEMFPSWNVAPGQDALAVRLNPETAECSLDALHWRLIPHWAKDKKISYRTINARSETVDKIPAFRQAFRKCRCLVCADGFYEWRRDLAGEMHPVRLRSDGVLMLRSR